MEQKHLLRTGDQLVGLQQAIRVIRSAVSKPLHMAEIGVYGGESTVVFKDECDSLISVDPWVDNYRDPDPGIKQPMAEVEAIFDERIAHCRNVYKMKMLSSEAVKFVRDQSLDFVYIDAIHYYDDVVQDIGLWLPKIKDNGHVGGHDYSDFWEDTRRAVNDVFGGPHLVFCDSTWLIHLGRRKVWLPK